MDKETILEIAWWLHFATWAAFPFAMLWALTPPRGRSQNTKPSGPPRGSASAPGSA